MQPTGRAAAIRQQGALSRVLPFAQVLFRDNKFQWKRLQNLIQLAKEGTGDGLDLSDTLSDGARMVLLDPRLRQQLIMALTEDNRLHIQVGNWAGARRSEQIYTSRAHHSTDPATLQGVRQPLRQLAAACGLAPLSHIAAYRSFFSFTTCAHIRSVWLRCGFWEASIQMQNSNVTLLCIMTLTEPPCVCAGSTGAADTAAG